MDEVISAIYRSSYVELRLRTKVTESPRFIHFWLRNLCGNSLSQPPIANYKGFMNVEVSENLTETDDRAIMALHGYRLASGLMWRDRHTLLLVPIVLSLPGVLRVLIANESAALHAITSLLLEGLRLLLLYILTIGILKPHQPKPDPMALRTLFVWGGSLWCVSMLPSIAIFPNGISLVVSAVLCFACTLMFYFFFTPIVAGSHNFTEIMEQTIKFTTFDTLMPLRALFTPFALAVFLAAIASDPMPSTSSLMYHEVCYGLATTLGTYCSVAFGVSYWARQMTPENQTNPCLERITLLEDQAPSWIYESLNFRTGITLALLALIFWTNSVTAIYSLSHNAAVDITRTTVGNRLITLHLDVHDTPSNLHHFHPMLLALASENRNYLAQYPSRIILNNEEYTPSQTIYSYDKRSIKDGVLHIAIHFDVDKDIKGISRLKDVYLWYATTKISRVKTGQNSDTSSTGTEIPETETPELNGPTEEASDMQLLPYRNDLIPGDDIGPQNSNEESSTPYVDVKNSSPLRIPLNRPRRLRGSRT